MEVILTSCIVSHVAGSACAVSYSVAFFALGAVLLEEEFETEGGCGMH